MTGARKLAWMGCAAVAIVGVGPRSGASGVGRDLRSKIDALAGPMIERGVATGFVIGVFQGGRTDVFSYGETARGSGVAPGADTVYEIGSITKVFTALLLADAVERGDLRFDDPVQKLLAGRARMPVEGSPITLAHLATHTSGLPRLPDNLEPGDPANPYADYGVEQMYTFLGRHRLRRAPGEYEYSNLGAGLLGHALAVKAGRSYEELLVERVLTPLGLSDTRITLAPDQRRRLAPGHDAGLRPAKNWDLPAIPGAGGLRSTCRDLLAFAKAGLDGKSGPLARAMALSLRERSKVGSGQAIGLGWHIAEDGVTRWHDGGTGGYWSWLAVLPDRGLAVVVLANTATERISAFGEDVTRVAAGLEVKPAPIFTEVEVEPRALQTYVGFYDLTPDFGLDVTLEEGRLMVRATGQDKYPVFASAPGRFFYEVVDAQLSFVPGPGGRVDRVVLHQGGRDTPGARRRE
jgi:CubicO group peptidase (beta-lactamase class C family)